MKKLLCFLFSLLVLSVFVGCGISSSEAERIIIAKKFPNKDVKGNFYNAITIDYLVKASAIEQLANDGYLLLHRKKVDQVRRPHYTLYYENPMKFNHRLVAHLYSQYYLNNTSEQHRFVQVPFLREYFVKVEKTWKDKRKGRENLAYATYRTELRVSQPYFNLLKDADGSARILVPDRCRESR